MRSYEMKAYLDRTQDASVFGGQGKIWDSVVNGFKAIGKALRSIANDVALLFVPLRTKPKNGKSAARVMQTISPSMYEDLAISVPLDMVGEVVPHYEAMISAVREIQDIEQRVYIPLRKYFEHAVTTTREQNELWAPKDVEVRDVSKIVKSLGVAYNTDVRRSEGNGTARFDKVYRSGRDFETANQLIEDLYDLIDDLDLKDLAKSELMLSEAIREYVEVVEEEPGIASKNKNTIRLLVAMVETAAKETELLGVLVYNTRAAIAAHNRTVDVLEDVL